MTVINIHLPGYEIYLMFSQNAIEGAAVIIIYRVRS